MSSTHRISLIASCWSLGACSSALPRRCPSSRMRQRARSRCATGRDDCAAADEPTAAPRTCGAAPAGADAASAPRRPVRRDRAPPRRSSKCRRARAADFDRAVNLMRAGNATEAELEFKQLAAGYPQLAGPHVNLGLLQRKAGRLDEAEAVAAHRDAAQSRRAPSPGTSSASRCACAGKFKDAASAYEQRASRADPELRARASQLRRAARPVSRRSRSARSPSSSATRSSRAKTSP